MPVRNEGRRSRIEVSELSEGSPATVDPEDAFKIIGNETRLTILDALWNTVEPGPMAFETLRRAVGVRDGSQFNYHLKKLLDGGFIEKVDGKYGIRHAGVEVLWAVRSGYLTEHPEIEPFETTGRCVECDAPLYGRYADEMFFIECSDCGRLHSLGMFPPNALRGRTPEKALVAYEQVMKTATALAAENICHRCNGPMERTVARDWSEAPVRTPYLDTERHRGITAWHVCSQCGLWAVVNPGDAVLGHPAVVDLYREHDIDLSTLPRWELPWLIDDSYATVVSEDPLRIELAVRVEGDELVVTLDEAFEVVSVD